MAQTSQDARDGLHVFLLPMLCLISELEKIVQRQGESYSKKTLQFFTIHAALDIGACPSRSRVHRTRRCLAGGVKAQACTLNPDV